MATAADSSREQFLKMDGGKRGAHTERDTKANRCLQWTLTADAADIFVPSKTLAVCAREIKKIE